MQSTAIQLQLRIYYSAKGFTLDEKILPYSGRDWELFLRYCSADDEWKASRAAAAVDADAEVALSRRIYIVVSTRPHHCSRRSVGSHRTLLLSLSGARS